MTIYVLAFAIGLIGGPQVDDGVRRCQLGCIYWMDRSHWKLAGVSWLRLGCLRFFPVGPRGACDGSTAVDAEPQRSRAIWRTNLRRRRRGRRVGVSTHVWLMSALAGVVGAVVGTLGGKEFASGWRSVQD